MKDKAKEKTFSENVKIAASQFIEEKEFWKERLAGLNGKSYFDYDLQAIDWNNRQMEEFSFPIPVELSAALIKLSGNSDPKLHMILAASITTLLAKCTGSDDIVMGTSIDKQEGATSTQLVNTILPLRSSIAADITFKELLLQIRSTIKEAIKNQNFPVETLVYELGFDTDKGFPLFDVAVILENLQDRSYLAHINHNITISFFRSDQDIQGVIEYNQVCYQEETIQRIINHLQRVMKTVLANVDLKISDIELINDEEKQRLLFDYNATQTDFPTNKTIHRLFEEQVTRSPNKIAVLASTGDASRFPGLGGEPVTYEQLNQEADLLAAILRKKGVGPGRIVAILSHRTFRLVTAVLAILKAGGAYLPIAIEYPADRKHFILADSATPLLLTEKELEREITWTGEIMDIQSPRLFERSPRSTLSTGNNATSTDPAYVIYTSGSTGFPKGVIVEHQGLVNYISFAARQYVSAEETPFPLYTSISFDLTVTSFFTPLVTGNAMVLYHGDEREFLIERIIEENAVGVIKVTPTHLKLIRNRQGELAPRLKRFIIGGENLETDLARDIYQVFNGRVDLFNEYGPTEAVVGCMIYRFDPANDTDRSVSIGAPIANASIVVLDSHLRSVPPGITGEIFIGGLVLARGYLNRPELTEERFIKIESSHAQRFPFIPSFPARFYKTGDLARWTNKNQLEFLGRIDHQVKIRGYRVELGEIENHILDVAGVEDVVVVSFDDGSGYAQLCAYYVCTPGVELSPGQLREILARELPDFMVPAHFILMEQFPVTQNGKIDRRALPSPHATADHINQYREPRTPVEVVMIEVWQDILGVEKIGIDDGYFSLGGDSVKAIQIASALQQRHLKMDITHLFQYPTIGELSPLVTPIKIQVSQEPVQGLVPLTPIQHWFFQKDEQKTHPFNMSLLLHRQQGYNLDLLEKVFSRLLEHHDALRMRFERKQGTVEGDTIIQFNRSIDDIPALVHIQVHEIENQPDWPQRVGEMADQVQQSVNPFNGDALIKLGLFKTPAGDFLLLVVHHLVMDGVSWRILLDDFNQLYHAAEKNQPLELPLKTTSYLEWAVKLCRYADSRNLLKELDYWKKMADIPFTPVPRDREVTDRKQTDTRTVTVDLSPGYTAKLLKEVPTAYNTEINDILIASLGLAFNEWGKMNTVAIELEGHGREDIISDVDINRTIGWFTSIYPVCIDMQKFPDIPAMVKGTKETLRRIPNKGIGYGVIKYLTSPHKRENFDLPWKPGISFNYLGQFDREMSSDSYEVAANVPSGSPVGPHMERNYTLDVSGIIVNQQLILSIAYHKDEYTMAHIGELIETYKNKLCLVIDHCAAKKDSELTVSDLSSGDFSEDEMNDIMNELQEGFVE